MAENAISKLPDVSPEDVGYRCRKIVSSDSVVIHFTDKHGKHHGITIAEDLPDEDINGLILVLEAMCHALNAGVDAYTLMAGVSQLYDFAKHKPFPLDGWLPLGMERTMSVRYTYRHVKTGECLVIAPDNKTELLVEDDDEDA